MPRDPCPCDPCPQRSEDRCAGQDPDLYSNRRLIEAGEERGHRMQFLNIRHCTIRLDPNNPEVHYRGVDVLSTLDAVTRKFQSMGVRVLNGAQAITASRDKLFASQQFVRCGLNTPVRGSPIRPSTPTT